MGRAYITNPITIGSYTWGERELAQIIRRKMITKSNKNLKKYTRKEKHKNHELT